MTDIEQALADIGARHGCKTTDYSVCDAHYSGWLPDYGCCYSTLLPLAAIGAAVERLPDDDDWLIHYDPSGPDWEVKVGYAARRDFDGPWCDSIPAAITAALGEDDE